MSKITIDLIEEGKIRALLIKINKAQKNANLKELSIEEFVSMLLASEDFIKSLDTLTNIIDTEKK